MKRLMFVLLMASLLLAACGGGAQPVATEAPAGGEPAATAASSAGEEPVEITFTMWGAPEEFTVWQALVDDFHKANPNITVNVDVSDWDSYWTKLNTLVAGGTPPDVFAENSLSRTSTLTVPAAGGATRIPSPFERDVTFDR